MKYVLLALLLSSTAALANPTVGDKVSYNLTKTATDGSVLATAVKDQEIVSYDESSLEYSLKITIKEPGADPVVNSDTATMADNFYTDEEIGFLLANCESEDFRGKLEDITVPAGTFKTCALENNFGGTDWVGAVKFVLVKRTAIFKDGTNFTQELASQK